MRRFECWLWTCGPFWSRTRHVESKDLFNDIVNMSTSICPGSEVAVGAFYDVKKRLYLKDAALYWGDPNDVSGLLIEPIRSN